MSSFLEIHTPANTVLFLQGKNYRLKIRYKCVTTKRVYLGQSYFKVYSIDVVEFFDFQAICLFWSFRGIRNLSVKNAAWSLVVLSVLRGFRISPPRSLFDAFHGVKANHSDSLLHTSFASKDTY